MSTLVANPPQPLSSGSGCPMSSSSSLSDASRDVSTCPMSYKRSTGHLSRPQASITEVPCATVNPLITTIPNLRPSIPPPELLYLPPLLSLLPSQTPPTYKVQAFSFETPSVGFTTSRLPSVDAASVALHFALHEFKPTTEDYAYAKYEEAFNWESLRLPEEVEREWYIVAFRSTRATNSPSRDLYEADRAAHEEAVTAGGLLAYWYGVPNSRGSNLATCIWMSRAHAVKASSGKKHVDAMRLATAMYENYDLERYVLKKVKGETGLTVEQWVGGEVTFTE
ncbi:hypothetical protein P7C70_g2211, partial [Phenoliferia sp. Uapishka_3]